MARHIEDEDGRLSWATERMAQGILHTLVEDFFENKGWEQYAEIAEDDWESVEIHLRELAPAFDPDFGPDESPNTFKDAYAFLASRADDTDD